MLTYLKLFTNNVIISFPEQAKNKIIYLHEDLHLNTAHKPARNLWLRDRIPGRSLCVSRFSAPYLHHFEFASNTKLTRFDMTEPLFKFE